MLNKNIKILSSDKEISQIAGKDNHFVGSPSNEICNDINWLIKNTQMSWGMFSDYYCTETDVGAGDKIKDLGIQGNVIYCARGVRKFAVKSHLVRMARTSQLQKTK